MSTKRRGLRGVFLLPVVLFRRPDVLEDDAAGVILPLIPDRSSLVTCYSNNAHRNQRYLSSAIV